MHSKTRVVSASLFVVGLHQIRNNGRLVDPPISESEAFTSIYSLVPILLAYSRNQIKFPSKRVFCVENALVGVCFTSV